MLSTIMSFCSSSYPEFNLSFNSGLITLIALKLKGIAYTLVKYNHIKTLHLNEILKESGINIIVPDSFDIEQQAQMIIKSD